MNTTDAQSQNEREDLWDKLQSHIGHLVDATGLEIDEGIRENVVALWAHNFPTYGSCEGHEESLCFPYVDIDTPAPQGWVEDEQKQKEWTESNMKLQKRMEPLLQRFYRMRTRDSASLQIEPRGMYGAFQVICEGAKTADSLSRDEQITLLHRSQQETREWTKFLKQEFFDSTEQLSRSDILSSLDTLQAATRKNAENIIDSDQ